MTGRLSDDLARGLDTSSLKQAGFTEYHAFIPIVIEKAGRQQDLPRIHWVCQAASRPDGESFFGAGVRFSVLQR